MDLKQTKINWVVAGLLLGIFVGALDQTIVSTAMPTVVTELGGFEHYVWVFSAYMIATVVATPIFGKLSDIYGRKLFFQLGLVLFLLGSVLCGIAGSMTELIVYRAIQGIGGGALMPIAFAVIFDIFPPEKRGKMNGLFGAVFGLSSVFGPALGAYITDYIDWRWVFYINVPIGLVALSLMHFGYREKAAQRKQTIDWGGATTLVTAILGFMFAIELGGSETYAWGSWQIVGLFALFVVCFLLFLAFERKVAHPIVELKLFKSRLFTASQAIGFLYGIIMVSGATYIPLFIQGVYGESASAAGQTLTPMMVAVVVSSMVGGRLINKMSYRSIMLISTIILAVAMILLGTMTVDTPRWTVTLYMVLVGLGIGVNFVVLNISVLHGLPGQYKGAAISLITFFRTIGSALGVTVLGVIQKVDYKARVESLFPDPAQAAQFADPKALLIPQVRATLPQDVIAGVTKALAGSISYLFLVSILITVVGFAFVLMLGRARMELPSAADKDQGNLEPGPVSHM
ncbi:MDR family MFS transporter [Paenibacillus ginsengarvi]|uniref:DHA2 family efflux MFS transporter permease subunit n=1 Tax=Paenibacillus ginsengarvi TaxID=400777 RepID=A0A3B0CJF6_9BACL|nr:MDR family MFS transporter [Paenibacillus ginsengarvi]RKN85533.1 DHA2 family efflux MFS transporter permease subunit [Paenibacillus ginsengarvi]